MNEEFTQITIDQWQQWKEDIRSKLQETAENFVYIGYRLKQIRDSGMHRWSCCHYSNLLRENMDSGNEHRTIKIHRNQ